MIELLLAATLLTVHPPDVPTCNLLADREACWDAHDTFDRAANTAEEMGLVPDNATCVLGIVRLHDEYGNQTPGWVWTGEYAGRGYMHAEGTWASWDYILTGTCDSNEECKAKCNEMCVDAGHSGACEEEIMAYEDGSRRCWTTCCIPSVFCFVDCLPAATGEEPEEGGTP